MNARSPVDTRTIATTAGVLFLWSLIPLALLVVSVLRHGGVLSGSDGFLPGTDQQLYLTFVRESRGDLLISNEYRLGDSQDVYLHPMYGISGLVSQLGLGLKVALLLWKPVAAFALAAGTWLYVRRFLEGRGRAAAAVLGLFFLPPIFPVLNWADSAGEGLRHLFFMIGTTEMSPAMQLWGYLHAALTIGLMPLFLLGVERLLDPSRRRPGRGSQWYLGWVSAAGLILGWLHPWKGATLLAILFGVAAWGRLNRRYLILGVPAAAIVAPMAYLALLPVIDRDWDVYAPQNVAFHMPLWMLAAVVLPLGLPALLSIGRVRPADEGTRMLLLWPPAGLAVYFLTDQFPFHALQGLSIPLAILAVEGFRRTRLPSAAAVAAVAVLTLPGVAFAVDTFQGSRDLRHSPYILHPDEDAALRHLAAAPRRNGVLARLYLGMTVPSHTGHDTWLGQYPWTPDFNERRPQAEELFTGQMPPAAARRFVRRVGASYLLTDCQTSKVDLEPLLGDLVERTHRFGCAAVYELAPGQRSP